MITQDKNDENVPQSEITKVTLVHCNFADKGCKRDQVFIHTGFLTVGNSRNLSF